MKEGRSLQAVATELDRQRATKRDFLADTRKITIGESMNVVELGNGGHVTLRPFAVRQIEEHTGVPARFADRLLAKHPDLLSHTLNELLHRDHSTKLLRTLDGSLRAFLSDSTA